MDLYIFPEFPESQNGYGIAVREVLNMLSVKEDDIVVYHTNTINRQKNVICLPYSPLYSLYRIGNVIHNRLSTELPVSKLSFLRKYDIENIYCDEVLFYRALRYLFPSKVIKVRFHNLYSRILSRKKLLALKVDWKFDYLLDAATKLEKEIINDSLAYKIFISQEDLNFYQLITGRFSDCTVWPFRPKLPNISLEQPKSISKLIWFGGIDTHKKKSIDWFVNKVLPKIQQSISEIEFHLWGRRTEMYNNPSRKIFGHGFWVMEGFPCVEGALYVNPDIIGGGVKLKLFSLIEEGIPFVSTVFGFEGYDKKMIDNSMRIVTDTEHFAEAIISRLQMGYYNNV